MPDETRPAMPKGLKTAIDFGPLILFFAVNYQAGLMAGTAVLVAATVIAIAVSFWIERRVPLMPAVGCAFVVFFGGLTLVFEDEFFIKIKPTAVNLLLAGVLLMGLLLRRNFLARVMGGMINIDALGWQRMTWAWIGFFVVLAVLNEIVWRNFSTDDWVTFKAFGIPILAVVFSIALAPLIQRHQIPPDETPERS